MDYAFLDHPGPIAYAHRGGSLENPENTMAAFEAATRLGFRYLETDVRMTADGVLVAFHDEDLQRMCGRPGKISDLPWSEVQTARVSGREPIPRIEDVLGSFPSAMVNLDAKNDACAEPLVDVIKRTNSTERVCVGAFTDRRLKRIRDALGPRLCTSMGPVEVARWRVSSLLPGSPFLPHTPVAQVPVSYNGFPLVTARSVRAVAHRGIQVHVWTIDEAGEIDRLLDLGVQGIITDRPTVLKETLERRGEWSS
jgi:glycerophosphoryl diester phosphodiesterase